MPLRSHGDTIGYSDQIKINIKGVYRRQNERQLLRGSTCPEQCTFTPVPEIDEPQALHLRSSLYIRKRCAFTTHELSMVSFESVL